MAMMLSKRHRTAFGAHRFLKSWVQSHYADKLLAMLRAELTTIGRIDLVARSAVLAQRHRQGEDERAGEAAREIKSTRARRPARAQLPRRRHEALGGSPLDPRLPSIPSWSAAPTRSPCGGEASSAGAARRAGDVHRSTSMPAWPGQEHLLQSMLAGNASRSARCCISPREVHVRLRGGAESADRVAFKEALRGSMCW